jgi:two-component system, OmpR family, sensor kinase
MRRRFSLRTYLFVATTAVVVLSVGLMLAIGSLLTRREVERVTLRNLSHQADILAGRERVAVFPLGRLKELRPSLRRQHQEAQAVPLDGPTAYLPGDRWRRVRKGESLDGTVEVVGTKYFYSARKVGDQALVLLRPKSVGRSAFTPFLVGLVIAALAGVGLAAIAAFLLARRIVRPIRRVGDAARHLAEERPPEPVPVEGALEVARLAEAFNHMAEQLARARAAERQFLLSVSHELKTPLTAIRGYAEGILDEAFAADEAATIVAKEAERLQRLVQDLLDLARMNQATFSVRRELIDLAAVAQETVNRLEGQARSLGVTLEAFAPGRSPAIGDTDRMVQVATNLVENALRLTTPGGVVRVVAEPGLLAVEDTGPGIADEDIPRAFERFYLYSRYGGERPVGTGLGLAIVKELTEGMGGRVEVASDGRGTRFTVHLRTPGTNDGFTTALPAANRALTRTGNDPTQ